MKQSVHDMCGHGKMWPRVPLVPTQREGRLGCSEEWMFIREVSSRSASNKSYEIHANTFFGWKLKLYITIYTILRWKSNSVEDVDWLETDSTFKSVPEHVVRFARLFYNEPHRSFAKRIKEAGGSVIQEDRSHQSHDIQSVNFKLHSEVAKVLRHNGDDTLRYL